MSENDVPEPKSKHRKPTILTKAQKVLSEKAKGGKVAIFTHPSPDPDAIGSFMGMSWFLQKNYEVEVDCFADGMVSHPQNKRMVNLLDPEMRPLEEFDPKEYVMTILVDTVPSYAAVGGHTISFDLVIDHHKETPNGGFKGCFLNLKAGSCCSTVYQLIKAEGAAFEDDNDQDAKVATAMLVGITTDTEQLMTDDTTEYEFEAYSNLFEYRNPIALKQIIRYKRPKSWIKARAAAASSALDQIQEGILIYGIGFISGSNRDLISDVADEMLTWENVETSVVFAVVDGDRIEGSIRSTNASLPVPLLCKEIGGSLGTGGGKLGKGRYQFSLGSIASDVDDDEDTKTKMWQFIEDREQKRVFRRIKK